MNQQLRLERISLVFCLYNYNMILVFAVLNRIIDCSAIKMFSLALGYFKWFSGCVFSETVNVPSGLLIFNVLSSLLI